VLTCLLLLLCLMVVAAAGVEADQRRHYKCPNIAQACQQQPQTRSTQRPFLQPQHPPRPQPLCDRRRRSSHRSRRDGCDGRRLCPWRRRRDGCGGPDWGGVSGGGSDGCHGGGYGGSSGGGNGGCGSCGGWARW
jgi:hypothetical protein